MTNEVAAIALALRREVADGAADAPVVEVPAGLVIKKIVGMASSGLVGKSDGERLNEIAGQSAART